MDWNLEDSPPTVSELTDWWESYFGVQETNLGGLTMSDFEKVLRIVKEKSFTKINGIGVDLFTASFIKSVYEQVNEANQKRMRESDISNLIGMVQTLMPRL